MTSDNILQLRKKNIKNVARVLSENFQTLPWREHALVTDGSRMPHLRVEQSPGALPAEVFQAGRPRTDQFFGRVPTLQTLECV